MGLSATSVSVYTYGFRQAERDFRLWCLTISAERYRQTAESIGVVQRLRAQLDHRDADQLVSSAIVLEAVESDESSDNSI